MKRFLAGVLGVLAGCASGAGAYPDTDVMEVPGFELKLATGIQKSGGLLQGGTLEYAGPGDLKAVYRQYVAAMRDLGWVSASDEIDENKAVGTLRKDNRTCALHFAASQGQVRATIKVQQTR
ncbi:MAG: hypothetical protein ACK44W_01050 [Planctomycetota bacterium]